MQKTIVALLLTIVAVSMSEAGTIRKRSADAFGIDTLFDCGQNPLEMLKMVAAADKTEGFYFYYKKKTFLTVLVLQFLLTI